MCKNIDIVEDNLADDYKPVFLNTTNIRQSRLPLHKHRSYFAKLEPDGAITIRIETPGSAEAFVKTTSDYSLFLNLFRFNE